jgi:hypothetical protein
MTWKLTEVLQRGFLDNSRAGVVSGRLVFSKAREPIEAGAGHGGDEPSAPFEVALTLTGNLPSPFSGAALRIENRGPMPADGLFLLDFPASQSGELFEASLKDDCLRIAYQARNLADVFYVELDIPVEWVTCETR